MHRVNTVTGAVAIADLGRTLMHEHVFAFHSDIHGDYPWVEEAAAIDNAVAKLSQLRELGFDTIVDLTVFGLGRNVSRVARVARKAEFNVIAATGLYVGSEMPTFFSHRLMVEGRDFLENLFVREIDQGIGHTGIQAAVIKCVTDHHGLTPDVETILRSVARAQLRTGVPISTHTDALTESGAIQQRIFSQEGVDLSEVIVGHSGDTTNLACLQRLMDFGSYIGMDRFGLFRFLSLRERIATVAALCRKGYAAQILLSHDANCGGDLPADDALRDWNYSLIPTQVIPRLRELGVEDSDIDLMTEGNPARIFSAAAAKAQALGPGSRQGTDNSRRGR